MISARSSGDPREREIANGLAAAVRAAIDSALPPTAGPPETAPVSGERSAGPDPVASPAWNAASNVAELLDLPGLSALLSACRAHAGAPPREVANALERLARLVRETESSGETGAFASADRELAAMAGTLEAQSWSDPAPGPGLPTEGPEALPPLAELLSDFELDDAAAVERAAVTLPVAAGLRAALDWMAADAGGRLHAELGEATLTIVARAAHEPGLGPAGAILALTGGALLPEPDGRWALRVPLHLSRPAFLLARQGELALAISWHAVAKLKIADEAGRAGLTEPSLPPWSPLARVSGERPAALLTLGLVRAWLHLDHIVWRVFARPEPANLATAVPGGRQVVLTEEGETYRVVEVDDALRGVPALHTPAPRPRPSSVAARGQASTPAPAPSVVTPPAESRPATAAAAPEQALARTSGSAKAPDAAAPIVLGPEFVRPLGARSEAGPAAATPAPPAPTRTPQTAPAPPPPERPARAAEPRAAAPAPAPAKAAEAVPAPAARRALVADDSLIARMELGRVLERAGWVVEWVETAAEMWSALRTGSWSAVFVDVFLPDATGRAHLKALVQERSVVRERFELVALTRDGSEELLVRDAGIARMLRKPFVPATVERLVRELSAVAP